MYKFLTLLLIISLFSCSKKEVKIPVVPLNGAEEVRNHSQIWMFYNKNSDLPTERMQLNEKNRISTTNWLFNIDKNLVLKEVLPSAIRLRFKHNEKSPHNDGGVYNYFSYINSLTNKLSFYQFDSIQFEFIKKSKLEKFKTKLDTIFVKVSREKLDIAPLKRADSLPVVQLVYEDNITFQRYLSVKAEMMNTFNSKQISLVEYIVSE